MTRGRRVFRGNDTATQYNYLFTYISASLTHTHKHTTHKHTVSLPLSPLFPLHLHIRVAHAQHSPSRSLSVTKTVLYQPSRERCPVNARIVFLWRRHITPATLTLTARNLATTTSLFRTHSKGACRDSVAKASRPFAPSPPSLTSRPYYFPRCPRQSGEQASMRCCAVRGAGLQQALHIRPRSLPRRRVATACSPRPLPTALRCHCCGYRSSPCRCR